VTSPPHTVIGCADRPGSNCQVPRSLSTSCCWDGTVNAAFDGIVERKIIKWLQCLHNFMHCSRYIIISTARPTCLATRPHL